MPTTMDNATAAILEFSRTLQDITEELAKGGTQLGESIRFARDEHEKILSKLEILLKAAERIERQDGKEMEREKLAAMAELEKKKALYSLRNMLIYALFTGIGALAMFLIQLLAGKG